MDTKIMAEAKAIICDKFPEMKEVTPRLSTKRIRAKGKDIGTLHTLTFQKVIPLPGESRLTRIVRITMDQEGNMVKLTSSK